MAPTIQLKSNPTPRAGVFATAIVRLQVPRKELLWNDKRPKNTRQALNISPLNVVVKWGRTDAHGSTKRRNLSRREYISLSRKKEAIDVPIKSEGVYHPTVVAGSFPSNFKR
jgi:hypothetical protein